MEKRKNSASPSIEMPERYKSREATGRYWLSKATWQCACVQVCWSVRPLGTRTHIHTHTYTPIHTQRVEAAADPVH